VAWAGTRPAHPASIRPDPLGYPWAAVIGFALVACLEAGVLYVLLTFAVQRRLLRVAAAVLLSFAATAAAAIPLHMEAPTYAWVHALWLLCVTACLLMLLVVLGARKLIQRLRAVQKGA